jgi:hypothetical protein
MLAREKQIRQLPEGRPRPVEGDFPGGVSPFGPLDPTARLRRLLSCASERDLRVSAETKSPVRSVAVVEERPGFRAAGTDPETKTVLENVVDLVLACLGL